MSPKTLARIGAVAFVAVAITATAIQMRDAPAQAPDKAVAAARAAGADPLRSELARCQSLGQDGARDADCLRAWSESRRRFLGLDAPEKPPLPGREATAERPAPAVDNRSAADPIAKATAPITTGGQ